MQQQSLLLRPSPVIFIHLTDGCMSQPPSFFGNRELPHGEVRSGQGEFDMTLQAEFFAGSYRKLGLKATTPRLQQFYKMIGDVSMQGQSFMFRLTGDFFGAARADLKADFHRFSKSIFMDIERTSPNEWLVIFAHEMSHVLDDLMFDSI